jgi:FkbM family methyltransferase
MGTMASIRGARDRVVIPARRTLRIATSELPVRSRLRLLGPARGDRSVQVGRTTVWLTPDPTDLRTLEEVLLVGEYADADYVGATVLDVGAHKGYFGAYALLRGAREVISVEPAPGNLQYLERAAASFTGTASWKVVPAAVSDRGGVAHLRLSDEAWRHSLTQGDPGRGVEVHVIPMAHLMAELGGAPLVVKIDVEGAEDEIVYGTPLDAWERCDWVFVETHEWARHTHAEVSERLALAGLVASEDRSGGVVRARRR